MPAFVSACLLACIPFLLAGCPGRGDEVTVDLNIAQLIPADWTPVGDLWEINIDGDSLQEYLLLFTYDNNQVGAVIYDPQLQGSFLGLNEPPSGENPPSSLLVPYRILPSYWANSGQGSDVTPGGGVGPGASIPRLAMGQGFIGAPGTAESITPSAVQRAAEGTSAPGQAPPAETPVPDGTSTATFDELLLEGDKQHMTFAWWRNARAGYGVTQIYAPGGLEVLERVDAGAENGTVQSVKGLYPYHDRSLLCREIVFTRTMSGTAHADSYRPDIEFEPSDHGIIFCDSPPEYPFYPEGVVLALTKDPSKVDLVDPQSVAEQLKTLLQVYASPIVSDLQTVATLPVLETTAGSVGQRVMTPVCAAISETDGSSSRRLLFILEHRPPTLPTQDDPSPVASDRLVITSMSDVTNDSETTTCAQLVMQTPPGAQ